MDEACFSGYCRNIDAARTVFCEYADGKLSGADCAYPDCPYAPECPVAKAFTGAAR